MNRWLHKSWQDQRSGWTNRVRWYQGETDIRLQFETDTGRRNVVYPLAERGQAQAAWEQFVTDHRGTE